MEIGRAFSFVQDDEAWVTKILLGGVIFLIPIVGQLAVLGYMLKLAQNVSRGVEKPMPAWNEFGDLLMRGLYYLVIVLVYMIPYLVVVILFTCMTGGIGSSLEDSESAGAVLGGLSCIIIPIMLLLALAGGVLGYVGMARYVQTDRLSAAFEFNEVIALLRKHIGLWLLALVVGILAGLVAQLGLIACGVGVLFTLFYAYCVQGHALGQILRTIQGEQGVPGVDPLPPAAPPTIQL
jgi:hypothetical protein